LVEKTHEPFPNSGPVETQKKKKTGVNQTRRRGNNAFRVNGTSTGKRRAPKGENPISKQKKTKKHSREEGKKIRKDDARPRGGGGE